MDYKETLNLPQTDFPMKANLAKREPEILARWEEEDIYAAIRDRHGLTVHDPPPISPKGPPFDT